MISRVERVDRVETFLSVTRPHSLIMDSRSSTEGSDTFTQGRICKMQLYDYALSRLAASPPLHALPDLYIFRVFSVFAAAWGTPSGLAFARLPRLRLA